MSPDGGVESRHALHGEQATAERRRPKSVRLAQPEGVAALGAGIASGPSETRLHRSTSANRCISESRHSCGARTHGSECEKPD